MKLISHRGNLRGPEPLKENTLDHILSALRFFEVEIDVSAQSKKLYLGHDEAQELVKRTYKALTVSSLQFIEENLENAQGNLPEATSKFFNRFGGLI